MSAHWTYPIIYALTGLLSAPVAGLLIVAYQTKQIGDGLVAGRLGDPVFPPGRRVIILGVWAGMILYAEIFFALGLVTRDRLGAWIF